MKTKLVITVGEVEEPETIKKFVDNALESAVIRPAGPDGDDACIWIAGIEIVNE